MTRWLSHQEYLLERARKRNERAAHFALKYAPRETNYTRNKQKGTSKVVRKQEKTSCEYTQVILS